MQQRACHKVNKLPATLVSKFSVEPKLNS
jgi:hypothetical protein